MKTLITFIIGLLVTLPVQADTTNDVLTKLETAGIQFAYAAPSGELRVLRTKATAEKVDALVADGTLKDTQVTTLNETLEKAMAETRRQQRLQE